MPSDLEAIGGVLVAGLAGIDAASRQAVEDSLLLAWRGACNLADDGGPTLSDVTSVMARIGWTISAAATETRTAPIGDIGSALEPRLPVATRAGIAAGGAPVDAWLKQSGREPILAAIAATGGSPALTLLQVNVAIPARNELWFGRDPDATVTIVTSSATLDPQVFDPLAATIAEKVKPYLKQVVREDAARSTLC